MDDAFGHIQRDADGRVDEDDNLDGGGDPAIVFDRAGVVYYADINFNRTDDTSGVWVNRSTNGGFTWTRPCVAIQTAPPPNEQGRCGGAGDPRQPGDGTVGFIQDNDAVLNGSVPAFDKEWITAGPRPGGVTPQCFTFLHNPRTCAAYVIGVDRLYVTYLALLGGGLGPDLPQLLGRSGTLVVTREVHRRLRHLLLDRRSPEQRVRRQPGLGAYGEPDHRPALGGLHQRRHRGRGPVPRRHVDRRRADVQLPVSRRHAVRRERAARGQRSHRLRRPRPGPLADNRNGTIRDSNNDVFFYKSTDGGTTWIGPTRVNNDRSLTPADRDCGRRTDSIRGDNTKCPEVNTGNDQFFPYVSINQKGTLNATFQDRRLDTTSTTGEWPTSRTEVGNYLVWYWGAQCKITQTATVGPTATSIPAGAKECLAPEAVINPTAVTGFNPGAGPVPGNGQNPATLPFRNFQISDWGTNSDYTFRAGLFGGDYTGTLRGRRTRTATRRAIRRTPSGRMPATVAGRADPRISSRVATRSASSRTCSSATTAPRTAATVRRAIPRTASTSSR